MPIFKLSVPLTKSSGRIWITVIDNKKAPANTKKCLMFFPLSEANLRADKPPINAAKNSNSKLTIIFIIVHLLNLSLSKNKFRFTFNDFPPPLNGEVIENQHSLQGLGK